MGARPARSRIIRPADYDAKYAPQSLSGNIFIGHSNRLIFEPKPHRCRVFPLPLILQVLCQRLGWSYHACPVSSEAIRGKGSSEIV